MKRANFTLALIATLLLLSAGAWQRIRTAPRADAGPYLDQIQHLALRMPRQFDSFLSIERQVPQAAIDMLRPNVLLSRSYSDLGGGPGFAVVLVHCADARDMFAHYPPHCYVMAGWRLIDARRLTRTLDGLAIDGMEYEFTSQRLDGPSNMRIFNTMLMADNAIRVDMDDMRLRALADNMRWYGAGQLQVIVSAALPPQERNRLYDEALKHYAGVIRAILSNPADVVSKSSPSGGAS